MSSFQEYGVVSERRRADLDGRRRKHLMIGGASACLLVLVVVGVVATVYNNYDSSEDSKPINTRSMHSTSKSVQMLCTSTDYQQACESSLSKVIKSDNSDPKELIKAAISVLFVEVDKAFSHTDLIKTNDSMVKGAIQDCKELYYSSKDELKSSLERIVDHGLENIPEQAHDVRTWLSAVMSYQQTCVDGFPEGELKEKLEKGMQKAKELTSNALAIIGQVSKFLSSLDLQGFSRKLLSEDDQKPIDDTADGFPSWISESDRRVLKEDKKIKLKPNVTVAKDGSGDFTTITEALTAMPKVYKGRYVIHVKAGIYEETVNVTRKMANVTMYGDGATKSIVTGSKNYVDGTRTFLTATFVASGDDFMAIGICFRNTAGAIKHQAVALRVQSDRSIFFQCRMEGYQDTLYAQTHRQFYRSCVISGTIDFIFGDAAAVFQNCLLVVRLPLSNQQNIVTAQGRIDRHETTGFILQKCRVVPDLNLKAYGVEKVRSYLGRPWKEYSKTIFMESEIEGFIHPDGYLPWEGEFALKTLFYAEYNNVGPGSNLTARVKWPGFRVIKKEEAEKYTVDKFIQGRLWIKSTAVPVQMGFYQ